MAKLADVKVLDHADGRRCTYMESASAWVYLPTDGGQTQQCHREDHLRWHWLSTEDDLSDGFVEGQDDPVPMQTFGEGMPTLGRTARSVLVEPDWQAKVKEMTSMNEVKYQMVVTQEGVRIEWGENGLFQPAVTDEAQIVLTKVLPTLLEEFLQKNQKYAEVQNGYDLGIKGIVPDLNRKLGIIKARVWDGAEEVGESTEEVAHDMIGHLLLFLAKMR